MIENVLYKSSTHRYDLILHKLSLNKSPPSGISVSVTFKIGSQITETKKMPTFFNKEVYFTEILTSHTTTLQDNDLKSLTRDKSEIKICVFLVQNHMKKNIGQINLDISKLSDELTFEKNFYITSENRIEFEGKLHFTIKKSLAHVSPSISRKNSNVSIKNMEKNYEHSSRYLTRQSKTPDLSPKSTSNYMNRTTPLEKINRSNYYDADRENEKNFKKLTNKIENQENSIEMLRSQITQLMQTVTLNSNLRGMFETPPNRNLEKSEIITNNEFVKNSEFRNYKENEKKKKNYENETTLESAESRKFESEKDEKIKKLEEIKESLQLEIKKKDVELESQTNYIKNLEATVKNLKNKIDSKSLESVKSEKYGNEDFESTERRSQPDLEPNSNEKQQLAMLNELIKTHTEAKSKLEEKNRELEEKNKMLENTLTEMNNGIKSLKFDELKKKYDDLVFGNQRNIEKIENLERNYFQRSSNENERNSQIEMLEKHRDNLKLQLKQREVKFLAMEEKLKENDVEMMKKENIFLKLEEKIKLMEKEISKSNKKLGDILNVIFEEGNNGLMEKIEKMLMSKYIA